MGGAVGAIPEGRGRALLKCASEKAKVTCGPAQGTQGQVKAGRSRKLPLLVFAGLHGPKLTRPLSPWRTTAAEGATQPWSWH